MTPKTLNTIAAVATIFSGIFALAATLIPITAIIAAPISLAFALVSGLSWLKAARDAKDYNTTLHSHHINQNQTDSYTKGKTIQHSGIVPNYHSHHLQNVLQHHNNEKSL